MALTADRDRARRVWPRVVGSIRFDAPGPTLVVFGGVHGNEPSGLLAAERVLEALHPAMGRGCVMVLAGNLAALNTGARYLDDDLNRLFRTECIEEPDLDHADQRELRELVEAFGRARAQARGELFAVDLHTTSAPAPPFIGMEDTLPARRFAERFGLPLILGLEEELRGLLFDYAAARLGHVAMVIEAGQHDDPGSVDVHEAAIWGALDASAVLDRETVRRRAGDWSARLRAAAGPLAGRVFDVRHREPVVTPEFEMAPELGAFDRVVAGRTPVAIDAGRTICAPVSGMLFMPNHQEQRRPGDDGFFVVREVGRTWLHLSAMLRSSERLHAWWPMLLPGVRRRAGRPGELVVAPEIAVVLRRRFFHLAGYRLVRWQPPPYEPRTRRLARLAAAIVGAAWRMASGAVRGGERRALPAERTSDWIVARRHLDTGGPWTPGPDTLRA